MGQGGKHKFWWKPQYICFYAHCHLRLSLTRPHQAAALHVSDLRRDRRAFYGRT